MYVPQRFTSLYKRSVSLGNANTCFLMQKKFSVSHGSGPVDEAKVSSVCLAPLRSGRTPLPVAVNSSPARKSALTGPRPSRAASVGPQA